MGKKNISNNRPKSLINGKYYPFVSVCTPTFNRRPFIENMFECFRNQTYPKDRIEWIIVDDGTDKIKDLIDKSGISQIRYFPIKKKMCLGEKRNYMHSHIKGSIVVYMDDDDYYPPERVEHSVNTLMENKEALCAGSSEIYIYFKHIKTMYQAGPYGPNHATAGTFAFRAELLKQTKYDDTAALAEEKSFLKDYTVPFVQLDPMKTILVFSHIHNTFDKRKMLENPHPELFRPSNKTVDDFICNPNENSIKKFFMEDIDSLLSNYEAGQPASKPDVLEQIKAIEKKREEMSQQMAGRGEQQQIVMERPGQPPITITLQDAVNIMQQMQQQIQMLTSKLEEKENVITGLQKHLSEKIKTITELKKSSSNKNIDSVIDKSITNEMPAVSNIGITELSKCEPLFVLDVSD
jgi:hypothetical protein